MKEHQVKNLLETQAMVDWDRETIEWFFYDAVFEIKTQDACDWLWQAHNLVYMNDAMADEVYLVAKINYKDQVACLLVDRDFFEIVKQNGTLRQHLCSWQGCSAFRGYATIDLVHFMALLLEPEGTRTRS